MAYTFKTYLYNEQLSKEQNLIMDKLYKLRMSGMAEALGLSSFLCKFLKKYFGEGNLPSLILKYSFELIC